MHFVSDLMTRELTTLKETDNLGLAESAMKHLYLRHLPVVQEGRLLGIVSSRNAMDPELEEFVSEQRRREHHR